ncbi:YfiR family protein [Nitrosomonas sp.]|uniref:YfiR family protein n=3 Tax=Nitrosomonas sp. TaxID=42353 RepID=UPI002731EA08|nr:YfiR family protein [Nitrosomonas sp.]MDP1786484.1 YfiR family protein [Nitrosomonas sp.]MDP2225545.1 YfiR family protein [Nitrosomonas sp.]
MKRSFYHFLFAWYLGFCLPVSYSVAMADSMIEYQVKAAFIYNFIAFTHWPDSTGQTINLCIYGEDYFGQEIDKLQNRSVNNRHIKVMRIADFDQLKACQAIFFSKSVSSQLSSILNDLQNEPILTLADSQNAAAQGVAINMSLINEKIVFEINLTKVRASGLDISSKLLQLAVKVHQ